MSYVKSAMFFLGLSLFVLGANAKAGKYEAIKYKICVHSKVKESLSAIRLPIVLLFLYLCFPFLYYTLAAPRVIIF